MQCELGVEMVSLLTKEALSVPLRQGQGLLTQFLIFRYTVR